MILMFNWILHQPLMKIITESPFKALLFRKISDPEVYLRPCQTSGDFIGETVHPLAPGVN